MVSVNKGSTVSGAITTNFGNKLNGAVSVNISGSLDRLVRPSVTIESFLRDRAPGALEVPEQESEIRWGKASSFQWSVTNPPATGGGGFTVNPGGDDEEEPEPGPKTLEFDETARSTENIRVENPSDSEQYVIVQRINDITFRGPTDFANALIQLRDGSISELLFKYILHHPTS